LRDILTALQPGPWLCEEHTDGLASTIQVMSLGGVPAWYCAARFDPAPPQLLDHPGVPWTVTVPREDDDPAPVTVRQMGFAALRILGMGWGFSHMLWWRRSDGTAVISDLSVRPPEPEILSLMGHAHDADLYRAWAKAVVHDVFTPIPRLAAAGAAVFRGHGTGSRVAAIHGWEALQSELGPLIVGATLPSIGADATESAACIMLRHEDTREVDRALAKLKSDMRIELG
jgi:hypothetical protein